MLMFKENIQSALPRFLVEFAAIGSQRVHKGFHIARSAHSQFLFRANCVVDLYQISLGDVNKRIPGERLIVEHSFVGNFHGFPKLVSNFKGIFRKTVYLCYHTEQHQIHTDERKRNNQEEHIHAVAQLIPQKDPQHDQITYQCAFIYAACFAPNCHFLIHGLFQGGNGRPQNGRALLPPASGQIRYTCRSSSRSALQSGIHQADSQEK